MFDEAIGDPRHLGGDCSERLALAVGIKGIRLDVAFVLLAEAVLAHAHGNRGGKPEREAQPCVAALGQLLLAAELAGLALGQVQAAVLQELPVVGEAAQIACFREDREREHRADTRHGA